MYKNFRVTTSADGNVALIQTQQSLFELPLRVPVAGRRDKGKRKGEPRRLTFTRVAADVIFARGEGEQATERPVSLNAICSNYATQVRGKRVTAQRRLEAAAAAPILPIHERVNGTAAPATHKPVDDRVWSLTPRGEVFARLDAIEAKIDRLLRVWGEA